MLQLSLGLDSSYNKRIKMDGKKRERKNLNLYELIQPMKSFPLSVTHTHIISAAGAHTYCSKLKAEPFGHLAIWQANISLRLIFNDIQSMEGSCVCLCTHKNVAFPEILFLSKPKYWPTEYLVHMCYNVCVQKEMKTFKV